MAVRVNKTNVLDHVNMPLNIAMNASFKEEDKGNVVDIEAYDMVMMLLMQLKLKSMMMMMMSSFQILKNMQSTAKFRYI